MPTLTPMRALMVALCISASVVLAPLWTPLVLAAWAADILGSPVRRGRKTAYPNDFPALRCEEARISSLKRNTHLNERHAYIGAGVVSLWNGRLVRIQEA